MFSALRLIAPLAVLVLGFEAAHAQANDMFPTRAAAEKRAKQLNCSGAFAMGSEWMPCKNFAVYENTWFSHGHGNQAAAECILFLVAPRDAWFLGELAIAGDLCPGPYARPVRQQGRD